MPLENRSPLKAIRQKCLDCHGNSAKAIRFCPSDGINSTWCALWPFRFGLRIPTAKRKYGKLMIPKEMPEANTPLYELPGNLADAIGGVEPHFQPDLV